MRTSQVYVVGAVEVVTVIATALTIALSVGFHVPIGAAAFVFTIGIVAAGALTHAGRMGVGSAVALVVVAALLTLTLSPIAWL